MIQKIIKHGERRETSFESSHPQRGEIYWADFTDEEEEEKQRKDKISKVRKKESQKDRPVVILSNNKQNKYSDDVIVALIQIDFSQAPSQRLGVTETIF